MSRLLVMPLLAVAVILGSASTSPKTDSLKRILNKRLGVVSSVHVVRLSDRKEIFAHGADELLIPASVTKLVTSAAGLVQFGPAHQFTTRLYHTGRRSNGVIYGDLVIVGDGDPLIVNELLWQLAADLRHLGLREVRGDLVLDNSLFDDTSRDKSRQSGARQTANAYDAPVSAFGVNFNTLAVALTPDETVGKKARVSLDPYPLDQVIIDNNIRTAAAKARTGVKVARLGGVGGQPEKVVASGSIAIGDPITKIYRAVGNHVFTSGNYVRSFLRAEGISIQGKTKEGVKPQAATLLIELPGYEMRRIVQGLNTFSNNYIADVLLKRLGADGKPGSGTYGSGLAKLRRFLQDDVKVRTPFNLENGSGLSPDNRLSARQLTELLTFMEQRMDVFPEFLASLPAVGWDGTLAKRFRGKEKESLKGLVRAKTGTLSEPVAVSSLGGYFRHAEHGLVAFAVLQNGVVGKGQPSVLDLRQDQDELLVDFLKEL